MIRIETFFDKNTFTLTYVVYDQASRDGVVIDPVLDYDPLESRTSVESVEKLIDFVKAEDLKIHYVLETHAHADHLSGSQELKLRLPGAKVGIGKRITVVQEAFKDVFDLEADFSTDGSQFDHLFEDKEQVSAGSLNFEVIYTPGHTPACVSYYFEKEAVFTGDALFMPDFGTGRCDFPAGSSADLYKSIAERLYSLPDDTKVFVGHDYMPGGREMAFESTIAEEKAGNIQLPVGRSEVDFIKFRDKRDAQLNMPRLIFQSVQVNIDAGKLPKPGSNNVSYLKTPVNLPG